MRYAALLLVNLLLVPAALGQSIEYSAQLNSGLFYYGGNSATGSSSIVISDIGGMDNYTQNPYGSHPTFSYGLAAQLERVTSDGYLIGVQAGYERLRSTVDITSVAGDFPSPQSAEGESTLTTEFVNLYMHFGNRFSLGLVDADLTVGPELGFTMSRFEKGEATLSDGTVIRTDTERSNPSTDLRVRAALTLYYGSWGLSAGYSHGVNNFSNQLLGPRQERYSRYLRFGLAYRIR